MRARYAPLLALALALVPALLRAAPPEVQESMTAEPGQLVRIVVKTPLDKDGKTPLPFGHLKSFKDTDAFWGELVSPVAGERHFVFQAPLKDASAKAGSGGTRRQYVLGFFTKGEDTGTATTVTVTYPDPAPIPQPTPTPAPGPQPVPQPTPAPDAPIPGAGLRVLVVFDAAKLSTLTAEQQGAIFSRDVRDYLRATCPKGPDGQTPEWRMWPADVDASGESKLWQDALKRPRAALPWVVVSNGTTGFEGPLPVSAAAMLDLLKKYGSK